MMGKYLKAFAFFAVVMALSVRAQTTVTNGNNGTTGTVPVYTGSATLGNSPLAVSGGYIGIGTTTPSNQVTISTSDDYGLYLNNVESAGSWMHFGKFLMPNMAAGDTANLEIGQAASEFDDGYIGFVYSANASTSNYLTLGLYSQDHVLNVTAGGDVGIGTTAPAYKLDVAGQIRSSSGGVVFPDGTTQTTAFIPANCGADYAESVGVTGKRTIYEPGDVLVIDPQHPGKFLKSTQAYSTMVAGIYSTKPGFIGRLHPASDKASADEIPMAMVGRVPTKVSAENGAIKVGDLLVTSSKEGYAMKGTDRSQMLGAVLGKALGSLDSGTGVIQVLVTLQ